MGTARLFVSESGLWPPWRAMVSKRGVVVLMVAPGNGMGRPRPRLSKQVQEKQKGPDCSGPFDDCVSSTQLDISPRLIAQSRQELAPCFRRLPRFHRARPSTFLDNSLWNWQGSRKRTAPKGR